MGGLGGGAEEARQGGAWNKLGLGAGSRADVRGISTPAGTHTGVHAPIVISRSPQDRHRQDRVARAQHIETRRFSSLTLQWLTRQGTRAVKKGLSEAPWDDKMVFFKHDETCRPPIRSFAARVGRGRAGSAGGQLTGGCGGHLATMLAICYPAAHARRSVRRALWVRQSVAAAALWA